MSSSSSSSSFVLVGGSKKQTLRTNKQQQDRPVTVSDLTALTTHINVALTELQRRLQEERKEQQSVQSSTTISAVPEEIKDRVATLELENKVQSALFTTVLDTMRSTMQTLTSNRKRAPPAAACEEETTSSEEGEVKACSSLMSSASASSSTSPMKKKRKNKHIHCPGILHYSGFKHELAETTEEYKRYNIIVSLFTGEHPQLARNTWHLRKKHSKLLKEAGAKAEFWTHMKLHKHIPTLPLDDDPYTGSEGPNSQLCELLLKVDKEGKTWIRYNA